jgi:hypothetical protein
MMRATETDAYDRGFLDGVATRQSVSQVDQSGTSTEGQLLWLRSENRRLRGMVEFMCAIAVLILVVGIAVFCTR